MDLTGSRDHHNIKAQRTTSNWHHRPETIPPKDFAALPLDPAVAKHSKASLYSLDQAAVPRVSQTTPGAESLGSFGRQSRILPYFCTLSSLRISRRVWIQHRSCAWCSQDRNDEERSGYITRHAEARTLLWFGLRDVLRQWMFKGRSPQLACDVYFHY